jgi:hypothetical protein
MNNKTASVLLGVALITIIVATGIWHHEHSALIASRAQVAIYELQPIATLVKENQTLLQELRSDSYSEKDSSILESYLAKIRREGVPKYAAMKQRLDQLAENNTAIVTLIKAYAPHPKAAAFTSEGDKFRN